MPHSLAEELMDEVRTGRAAEIAMSGWRDVHIGFEGAGVRINGVAIWWQEWRRTGEDSLELPHPSRRQKRHRFNIYAVGSIDDHVRFAAGELSNGVWGFYVPA